MPLTWKIVDTWRQEHGIDVAEMARRAGLPERTVYTGLSKNRPLRSGTRAAVRQVFPEKFTDKGEVRNG